VHAELAALEQARSALATGEAARALSILDAYASDYPRGSMAPEATVLRVEALVRAGDLPAARRVGTAFLATSPGSAYAPRVRSLIGESNP
jgi:outer membrane protein assembly factor BamD (BamD/ComL family)